MSGLNLLELRWHVDSHGYMLDPPARAPTTGLEMLRHAFGDESWQAHVVVPRGGQPRPYRCKANDLGILHDLLNVPRTPEGVLVFVKRWGLLDAPSRSTSEASIGLSTTAKHSPDLSLMDCLVLLAK